MDELKTSIKNKTFKRLYVLYGDEAFLKKTYAKQIINAALGASGNRGMNLDTFDEKTYSAGKLADKCQTAPFMADYRVVLVTDSNIFAAGKSAEAAKTEEFLKEIPESTIVIFIESKTDKRLSLFKTAQKIGLCEDVKKPGDSELIKWVIKGAKSLGRVITPSNAAFFLQISPSGMDIMRTEIDKLVDYTYGGLEIEKADILAVVTRSSESRIFDLTDAIGMKKTSAAIDIYYTLLYQKESPLMILTMLARQFKLILACAELSAKKKSNAEIAKLTDLRSFAVPGTVKQGKNFTQEGLLSAYKACLETDVMIKSGRITDTLGVLMIILKYAG